MFTLFVNNFQEVKYFAYKSLAVRQWNAQFKPKSGGSASFDSYFLFFSQG